MNKFKLEKALSDSRRMRGKGIGLIEKDLLFLL